MIKYIGLLISGGLIISSFISLRFQKMQPVNAQPQKQGQAFAITQKPSAVKSPFYNKLLVNLFTH